jgi:CRISPR-associated protein Csh2
VIYKEDNYHIGDLDKKIHIKYEEGMSDEKIRSVNDFKLDVTELWQSIEANKNKILALEFQLSPDLNFVSNGQSMTSSSFKEALEKNFKATDLHLQ